MLIKCLLSNDRFTWYAPSLFELQHLHFFFFLELNLGPGQRKLGVLTSGHQGFPCNIFIFVFIFLIYYGQPLSPSHCLFPASPVCQQLGVRGSLHILYLLTHSKNWMSLIKLYQIMSKMYQREPLRVSDCFPINCVQISLPDRDRTPIGFIFSLSNLRFYEG